MGKKKTASSSPRLWYNHLNRRVAQPHSLPENITNAYHLSG
jgi:hypothetical protein